MLSIFSWLQQLLKLGLDLSAHQWTLLHWKMVWKHSSFSENIDITTYFCYYMWTEFACGYFISSKLCWHSTFIPILTTKHVFYLLTFTPLGIVPSEPPQFPLVWLTAQLWSLWPGRLPLQLTSMEICSTMLWKWLKWSRADTGIFWL